MYRAIKKGQTQVRKCQAITRLRSDLELISELTRSISMTVLKAFGDAASIYLTGG
jgi:hypothetical protein